MIDLEALEQMAADVDRIAIEEPNEPKKRKRRSSSLKDLRESEVEEEEAQHPSDEQPLVYDPEFEIMITSLVGDVVEKCKESLDWSDPGLHWRNKVGGCVARIVQKRITRGRHIADEVVLLGYLALWIGPNVKLPRFGGNEDSSDIRDHGKRQDLPSPSIS